VSDPRKTRLLILIGVMAGLAACNAPATEATTTTSTLATTTTTSTTATTSTTQPTTTTTTLPPTTTPTLVSGVWGDQPLVVYDDWGGMALGWWDGSAWVQVDESTPLPIVGGEDYQVALVGSSAILEGGEPVNTGCDVILEDGLPSVHLDDGNALYTIVDDGKGGERFVSGVAITAPWNLTPRPVTDGESHPDLEEVALGLLAERGLDFDRVNIVQALDADLDGDGAIETLLVAEETEFGNEISGVYSILFAVSPSWDEPAVVDESVIPSDDTGYPASFRVSAVADLSGDGQMEVVASGLAWEGSWVSVYELTESGFEYRIGAGCGV
jgi:hypothetical protein